MGYIAMTQNEIAVDELEAAVGGLGVKVVVERTETQVCVTPKGGKETCSKKQTSTKVTFSGA